MTYAYIQPEDHLDVIKESDLVIIVESFLDINETNCELSYKDLVDVDIEIGDVFLATIQNFSAVIDTVREKSEQGDLITVISSNHDENRAFSNMLLGRVLSEQLDIKTDEPTDPTQVIELLDSIREKWESEKKLFGQETLEDHYPSDRIGAGIYNKVKTVPIV